MNEEREEMIQDKMIRASRKAGTSTKYLMDIFTKNGLIAVYNLGLRNMLEYLEEYDKK